MAAAPATCLSVLNAGRIFAFRVSLSSPASLKLPPAILSPLLRKQKHFFPFQPCSFTQSTDFAEIQNVEKNEEGEGIQEVEKNEEGEENQEDVEKQVGDAGESIRQEETNQRKLYVVNLPWSYPASDLENLFGQCGSVSYVEMIKMRDGRNRGFAFVTMASPEEAQAAMEKFDSFELEGRIIRVQLAKSFSKPTPKQPQPSTEQPQPSAKQRQPSTKQPQPSTTNEETTYKVYVGNLNWKARATNLREFFSAKFKPVTARVVFENPSVKSAGYGFVSFATKEEMEAVVSELDGVELMGRPLRLRIGQRNSLESQTLQDDSTHSEGS